MDIMKFNMGAGVKEYLDSNPGEKERLQAIVDAEVSKFGPDYFSETYSCLYMGPAGEPMYRLD